MYIYLFYYFIIGLKLEENRSILLNILKSQIFNTSIIYNKWNHFLKFKKKYLKKIFFNKLEFLKKIILKKKLIILDLNINIKISGNIIVS